MHKRRSSLVLYVISGILFLVAVIMFCSPYITNYITSSYHPRVTRGMIRKTSRQAVSYGDQVAQPAGFKDSVRARRHKDVRVLGQMIAPHLHLPIDAGDGTDSLLLGAGTMTPDQHLGQSNYNLASHHMRNRDALFSPLYHYARPGTKVWLTDDKNVYEYQIDQRKNVDETDVKILNPTRRPTLTLVTCQKTLGGRIRTIFIGHLIRSMKYHKSPGNIQRQFSQPCNNHNVLAGY